MTIARSTFDKNGRLAQGAVFIPKGKGRILRSA